MGMATGGRQGAGYGFWGCVSDWGVGFGRVWAWGQLGVLMGDCRVEKELRANELLSWGRGGAALDYGVVTGLGG